MRFMVSQPAENQPHYLRGYAKDGDEEWVRKLLTQGVDVNAQDEHGMTALHLACLSNKETIVQLLLDQNAQISILNSHGQSALHLAATCGNCDMMRQLLRGPGRSVIDLKANKSGHTALHYASRHGHADMCRLLLEHGATKHIPDTVRLAPVKYAKDSVTRSVFEESITAQPASAPAPAPKSIAPPPKVTAPPPPKPTSPPPPKPVAQPAPKPPPPAPTQPPKPTAAAAPRRQRSKSSDPPKESRARDPSTQRQINAQGMKTGRGQLNRNNVSIFNEKQSRDKAGVGPVIVGKKGEGDVGDVKNHKMTFSDEHKKRMQMSVFDRLAGGSKKK